MSKKREILRRAVEIFERKGYSDTSIEEIADAVGVKREAIYYYFKNKAQILNAVIRPQSVSLLEGLDGILELNISSREKLLLALQNHIDRFNPSFLEMSVIARDHQIFESLVEFRDLSKIWRNYSEGWIKLVTEGQQSGQFFAEIDPKVVAFGILGMCNWLSRWYDPSKSVSARDIVRIYFQLIGGGLIKDFEDTVKRPAAPAQEDRGAAPPKDSALEGQADPAVRRGRRRAGDPRVADPVEPQPSLPQPRGRRKVTQLV